MNNLKHLKSEEFCTLAMVYDGFQDSFQAEDEKDDIIPPPATLVFSSSWCETLPNRFPFMHQLNL